MTPTPQQEQADRNRLEEQCFALEAEAGIAPAMERAREGRFMPDVNATPEAYFADERDCFSERARDAYFGVQDLDLRKRLIRTQRLLDAHLRQSFQTEVMRIRSELANVTVRAADPGWTKAALIGAAVVASGYLLFSVAGAIGGAGAGFFLGQGAVARSRRALAVEAEEIRSRLHHAEKDLEYRLLWPEVFTSIEEASGERQAAVDQESAYGNVLRHEARARP